MSLAQDKRRHTAEMRKLAKVMASYTNDQLRLLAVKPEDRARMEKVLASAKDGIRVSTCASAKRCLQAQAGRLQRALNNPAIAA